jgi:hypothetical protein
MQTLLYDVHIYFCYTLISTHSVTTDLAQPCCVTHSQSHLYHCISKWVPQLTWSFLTSFLSITNVNPLGVTVILWKPNIVSNNIVSIKRVRLGFDNRIMQNKMTRWYRCRVSGFSSQKFMFNPNNFFLIFYTHFNQFSSMSKTSSPCCFS